MSENTEISQRNKCWEFYIESVNFGSANAYQSALKAGYSEDHARNITLQGWFKDKMTKLTRKDILSKAENLLIETLDIPHFDANQKLDFSILKIKLEIAKHITSTLGKKVGYSDKIDEDEVEQRLRFVRA